MRNRLAVLVCLWLASMLPAGAAAAIWSLESDRLVRHDKDTRYELAPPGNVHLLAPRTDGGIWLSSGNELWSLADDGRLLVRLDLLDSGLGRTVALAADPYDGSVWIATDEPLLLRIDAAGTLVHGTTLLAPAAALAVDLAQGAWLVVGNELLHVAHDGRWIATTRLPMNIGDEVRALAVDALHDRIWVATTGGLQQLSSSENGEVRRVVSGEATAIATDARSDTTVVIVGEKLVVFDAVQPREAPAPFAAMHAPVSVAYDAIEGAFTIASSTETFVVASDGTLIRHEPSGQGAAHAGTPFRVDPTITLVRPPSGASVSDPNAQILMRLGARCNDVPCETPSAYVQNMTVEAMLGSRSLGNPRIGGDGSLTFAGPPALHVGENRVTARATDMFGHTVTLAPARLTLLRDSAENIEDSGPTAGRSDDVARKAANKVPIVTLTSPLGGARFPAGAPISLTAAAGDPDGSIVKVEFYAGSALIGSSTTAPYQYVWTNAAAGTYALTAKAYDNRNATAASSPVSIVVVANVPPTVELTSPSSGFFTTPGSTVALVAAAGDTDGRIISVQFFDGAVPLGSATSPPYQFAWTPSTTGHHAITARATDDGGGVTQSPPVDVVVGGAPVVIVTSPAFCATLDGPLTVFVAADAAATPGSIRKVEFFDNDASVGVATTAPWQLMLLASVGSHAITAKATDDHGLVATSRPSTFTVRGPNQPPTVVITSPSEGARFPLGSAITLSAGASDTDGTVRTVEFRIGGAGGALIGRSTSVPYTLSWTNVATGSYTIVAVATDDRNGTSTSSPIHLTVAANVPPSVAITTPPANANFTAPASITISATAADADGSIEKVEFFAGTTLIGATSTVPYSVVWNAVAAGSYAITARATDTAGGATTSAPVTISVASNSLPTVSLTAPASGTQFFAPATVSLLATPRDADGSIGAVDYYANGSQIGHATSAPYRAVWDGVAAGTYVLTAKATDNLGGVTISSPVSITVTGAPTLNLDSALQGSTIDADTVLVRGFVNAPPNSAMTVNGVVAHIDDFGRFGANKVPLVPGQNTIQAVVTTQDGQSASQTITLTSSGPGAFDVQASPTEGIESLQVTITIENRIDAPFKQINVDLENDGFPNLIVTPDQLADSKVTLTATYPVGTWTAIFKAYDANDKVIYSSAMSIVVRMPEIVQGNLLGIYEGMLSRLRAGNVSAALTAFTGSAHDKYAGIFTDLAPGLADVIDRLGTVAEITFNLDIAEIAVERDTPDGPQRFMIYLVRSEDGIWRIDDM